MPGSREVQHPPTSYSGHDVWNPVGSIQNFFTVDCESPTECNHGVMAHFDLQSEKFSSIYTIDGPLGTLDQTGEDLGLS